nr:esterase-like activity of phytase family protein [Jannaschia sp. Os4]
MPFVPWEGAGGWSALWVAEDGGAFAVVSDRGAWAEGRLLRDAAGDLAGAPVDRRGTLEPGGDSEALDRFGGGWAIGFEGNHRVEWREALDGGVAADLGPPPDLSASVNAGIEALAVDPLGRIHVVSESPAAGRFDVHRWERGAWEVAFAVPADGRYRVTGADFGPDGRLWLLERDFLLLGFRTRLRSVRPDGTDLRTDLETALARHDNLEGLAVWRGGHGLRATMVSDDNLRSIQRSEIVEYRLGD